MSEFAYGGLETPVHGYKKEKKRNLLRKLFRGKKKPSPTSAPPIALTEEQQQKIKKLSNFVQGNIGVEPDPTSCQHLLEQHKWDLRQALVELNDFQDADDGILVTPNPLTHDMLGSENDQLTSCYIDALLFSMYATTTAFDPLLTSDTDDDDFDKRRLQTALRLFVNRLRDGHLVRTDQVRRLRKALEATGWEGHTYDGAWSQEDTSEFFLHLTNIFGLPFLPFQVRLYHGASKDTDDDRVMTERTLILPIPTDSNTPINLQEILIDLMYNNMVTGVKRNVFYDEPDEFGTTPSSMYKAPVHVETSERQVSVAAWQVLELLPFYSGINEQGDRITASHYQDGNLILPMVLKRYSCDNALNYRKIQREVIVPPEISFERFLNQNIDNTDLCQNCGLQMNSVVRLRSAVCHRGDSPFAGHYIAYACIQDPENGYEDVWLKFDDMNVSQRVKKIKGTKKEKKAVFDDLATSAYMLFYELDRSCSHCHDKDYAVDETLNDVSPLDLELKTKLQTLEVKGSDGRLYS
ncbi:hypothetical protein INT44_000870, partial [Umbelopsis vinacea]